MYGPRSDWSKVRTSLTAWANNGDVEAMEALGECYVHGFGVTADTDEAERWFVSAAKKDSQYGKAMQLFSGWGEEEDTKAREEEETKAAFALFKLLAERGHAPAQCRLAWCYLGGHGVAEDRSLAAQWYVRSAEMGHGGAQCWIGQCYRYGAGVAKDVAKAREWYGKAAIQGHAWAQNQLETL